jgi:hypothetical protein
MNETNLTDILDIKPPMETETGGGSILLPIIFLVVLFLIGAALLFWAYYKPKTADTPAEPDTDAHRKLRQAWALLGTPALFAEAVADILRVYLGQRFTFHAPERTTDEFLQELQRLPQMTDPQKTLLGQFLVFCDLSKFAQHDPSEEECRNLHAIAVQLINETAPALPGAVPPQIAR